jgi:hypothetical protein
MNRAGRLVAGLGLSVAGILLALYGLFAILYRGDSGSGNTYVKIGSREIDAGLVGLLRPSPARRAALRGPVPEARPQFR